MRQRRSPRQRGSPAKKIGPEAMVIAQIKLGLQRLGVPVFRINSGAFMIGDISPRFFRAGFNGCPDLVALLGDGRTLWIEAKAPRGKLSRDQEWFRDLCRERATPWVCARSFEDLEASLIDSGDIAARKGARE